MRPTSTVLSSLPSEFTSRVAFEAGLSQGVVERLVSKGHVTRVRRGVFRRTQDPDPTLEPWRALRAEHLTRLRLALLTHPQHAASHMSAAVVYDWPTSLTWGSPVHLTGVAVRPRSRREAGCTLHHSDSMANDVMRVDDLAVLAPARTVVDCLRMLDVASAVALADGALRAGSVTREEVEAVLAGQRRWVGRPRAVRALRLVDGRRESWLESVSVVQLFELGVDLPIPQVEVFDQTSRFVARVDGLWLTDGTVGEADGAGKYRKAAVTPEDSAQTAAQAVVLESRRERSLLALGLEVVRWDTEEITRDAPEVARRVMAARARGDIRRFRGRLRSGGKWLELPGGHPDPR